MQGKESGYLRIVVLSDTHGNTSRLEKVIFQQPKADCFIHLGDGQRDMEEVMAGFPGKDYRSVAGNCDFAAVGPDEDELVAAGKRIFFTHGHRYFVKGGPSRIIAEAVNRHADILLYGHTHVAVAEYDDGLYVMNPGSLGMPDNGMPTYGVIDITPAGIVTNIVEV